MNSTSEVRVVVPKHSYGKDSLKVKGARNSPLETQRHMQEIAHFYNERGINAYLIYAHKAAHQINLSGYHIIPYPENEFWFFQQIKVLWRVTFGPYATSSEERRALVKTYEKKKSFTELIEDTARVQETLSLLDPFCKAEQVAKQNVFEGKHIHVLLNFAPLVNGEREFHILLIPKEHYMTWCTMPEEIFKEGEEITLAIAQNFQDCEIYDFTKNGKRAGQTQEHCHKNIVVVANETNAFFGKLHILQKMIFGSRKLSDKQLKASVERVATLISPVLTRTEDKEM